MATQRSGGYSREEGFLNTLGGWGSFRWGLEAEESGEEKKEDAGMPVVR